MFEFLQTADLRGQLLNLVIKKVKHFQILQFCSSGRPDGATRSLPGLGRGGVHLYILIFPSACSQSLNTVIFVNAVGLCMSNVKPAADVLVRLHIRAPERSLIR